jgi:hypothetical protein
MGLSPTCNGVQVNGEKTSSGDFSESIDFKGHIMGENYAINDTARKNN